jgi:Putative Flp pilus-assembly TadE/G-like
MTLGPRRERGSVMVLTAVAMVPFVFLMAFAIDVSHWWDYSRNLQNRADAAALAGGTAFGNICLEGGNPGNVRGGAQSVIGEWAQLYSGAGTSEPSGLNTTQLPYANADVTAGTGWNVTTNGYLNNTFQASPVPSPLTLKLGSLNDYWVVLNGNDYAESGGTSFSMMPLGSGATFCNSDPTQDLTDPQRGSAGSQGPMVDVKVSQKGLPLFFPLIPIRPTIHAHARVQLEGEASTVAEPIAVSDTGYTPCVTVYFKSTADNSVLGTAVLTKEPQAHQTDPIIWDNSAVQYDSNNSPIPNTGPASVKLPTNANVYVQPYLNNCNGSGQYYDDSSNTGVLYINSHPASAPTVSAGDAPQLTCSTPADCTQTGSNGGGVFLTAGTCAPDQYFSVGDCQDVVNAYVKYALGVNNNDRQVFYVDHQWDPTANNGAGGFITSGPIALSQDNSDPTRWYSKNNPQMLSVPDQSGIHEIEITWQQTGGTINGTTCGNGNGNNPPPCTGSFGLQAQAFGACNGCDQPDDSGPIVLGQLRLATDGANTFGENSLPEGTTQQLVVKLQLSGLASAPANAGPADDTILRFPTSGNHQTGLVDCGQGQGGNMDAQVVYAGCGPGNPYFTNPPLNPLYIYSRADPTTGCIPATDGDTTDWPSGNHQDCVQTTPGTRRKAIICSLVLRMTGEPFGTPCNNNLNPPSCGGAQGKPCCPPNLWGTGAIQGDDPRAVTMIITSAVDLASAGNSPNYWIPIRRFATFYVTGWDKNINPQCSTGTYPNDPFPGKGKLKSKQDAAVWGHWMNYTDTAGIGNNESCPIDPLQPTNCVPVLTR